MMQVFNIRKSKYADSLIASGVANRWNKNDEFVIYAGGSIALATLELVAHRNAISMDQDYKLMFINVDISESEITEINMKNLPENWKSIESYPVLQKIGSDWYKTKKSLLLKVPSVIVPWESNYLINTQHPDFHKKVSLHNVENFIWDRRIL